MQVISTERDLMTSPQTTPMPGEELKAEKMPGHWLLARLGKRVLRPGGRQLTNRMIEALNIRPSDEVIEFAPGLGATARLTLKRKPTSYTAVERDKDAAAVVQKPQPHPRRTPQARSLPRRPARRTAQPLAQARGIGPLPFPLPDIHHRH